MRLEAALKSNAAPRRVAARSKRFEKKKAARMPSLL